MAEICKFLILFVRVILDDGEQNWNIIGLIGCKIRL